jgi:hypothetical protein
MHELIFIFLMIGAIDIVALVFFGVLSLFSRCPSYSYLMRERPPLKPWMIDKNPGILPFWLSSYIRRRGRSVTEQAPDKLKGTIIAYRRAERVDVLRPPGAVV